MSILHKSMILFKPAFAVMLFAANVIHPLIHGTPLDMGSMDVLLQQANAYYMAMN